MFNYQFYNLLVGQLRMICYPYVGLTEDSINVGELMENGDRIELVYNLMPCTDKKPFIIYILVLNKDLTLDVEYAKKNPHGTFALGSRKNRMRQSLAIEDVYELWSQWILLTGGKYHVWDNKGG